VNFHRCISELKLYGPEEIKRLRAGIVLRVSPSFNAQTTAEAESSV
jgi:hypothetical protein